MNQALDNSTRPFLESHPDAKVIRYATEQRFPLD